MRPTKEELLAEEYDPEDYYQQWCRAEHLDPGDTQTMVAYEEHWQEVNDR